MEARRSHSLRQLTGPANILISFGEIDLYRLPISRFTSKSVHLRRRMVSCTPTQRRRNTKQLISLVVGDHLQRGRHCRLQLARGSLYCTSVGHAPMLSSNRAHWPIQWAIHTIGYRHLRRCRIAHTVCLARGECNLRFGWG